jgi:anthranilate synthase/aminodeoxychorismate synthase-like glutamine amidotransferase
MLNAEVIVRRNDAGSLQSFMDTEPTHIVISPGPGHPKDAGCCIALIREYLGKTPILGVCLGHQCLAYALGGDVIRAPKMMHGKTSTLRHTETELFNNCPNPMEVGRYHSLVADPDTLPQTLRITAQTDDQNIMAVAHESTQTYGVQFHPESILTPHGPTLLNNFLQHTGGLQ